MSTVVLGNVSDDVGSVAALRVALQTLAERCERLQTRLDIVEKENVSIKGHCTCQAMNSHSVQMNVQELSCKMSQLVEYLRIVTDENRMLWAKLSSFDNPVVPINDKVKPKNSLAIIDNYLKHNGMIKICFSNFLNATVKLYVRQF